MKFFWTLYFRHAQKVLLALIFLSGMQKVHSEAMLQLFNVSWEEMIQKMPEIAEAGYTSLWLPPPAKASSAFSVGYDLFDPFDLGDKNQRGTIRTRYGSKEELLRLVEMAHRFGMRVYFDNIMNHRGFDTPGYNAGTSTNIYPGLFPEDFHLRTTSDGFYRNWDSIADYNNLFQVQNRPLFGLIDLANEPGSNNNNFGPTEGSVRAKISRIRQPNNREYYMDPSLPAIAGPWRPFNGTNGSPVAEDVNAYLIRAAIWMLNETKCDGFRFDAAKHVPSGFFGDTSASANGYVGAIQTMFDYVHGYGNNVTGNGYVEPDNNRNSTLDSETTRNDALLFGEHLGEPPGFQEYLDRGMRLINFPYHFQLNNILGNPGASLSGLDQRDYRPYPSAFSGAPSVLFSQSHDDANATRRELQNAYNFLREGLPVIYSDGYNQSSVPDYFPRVANAPYLGEFGDNKMPDVAWLHHQLARGGTRGRWSDADIVALERYDYREGTNTAPQDQTVVLFAMNDNYGNPGDISFDDGVTQLSAGTFYECFPAQNSRGVGLVVDFPPGSVLSQLADSPGKDRACTKLLVRQATQILSEAQSTANDPNPMNRKIYVGGQTLAPGGGAIELKIPSGGYVAYGYQWAEASRAGFQDAITFQQNGVEAKRLVVQRQDGVNGDTGFNPVYPFKMRGSVDQVGNVIRGTNFTNRIYTIDVPVVTNAPFDILVRNDASSSNVLVKLDGGVDVNSQMNLGPTNGFDRRDNRPGYATDVFLGYEQAAQQFRNGPEKFAARDVTRDNIVSLGAETYHYTVGGTNQVVNGSGGGLAIKTQTADFVYHDPNATTTVSGGPATQRFPLSPTNGQTVEVWVKVGYQFQINKCFVYFTTDGTNPEGSFGVGRGTTKIVEAFFGGADMAASSIDWWKGIIPATNQINGAQIRYKVALHKTGVAPISDSDDAKWYGLSQWAITNFNPATAAVWLHNDLKTSETISGLREGFHIVRARTFLPRVGKSSVFNTFLQTFYYDAQPPDGVVAFPGADGNSISNTSYTVVVRADSTVTGVEFNLDDSDATNDDAVTGQWKGNGRSNGVPNFATATAVTPDATLNQPYPNLPQEFRFTYSSVPSSGTATITVRLKELTSTVFSNRVTTLTRTVNTLAPAAVVRVSNPGTDGQIYLLNPNDVFLVQACFTSTLTTNNSNFFSLYLNSVFQPRSNFIFLPSGCGPGMRSLYYYWTNPPPGWNTIQIVFTNFFTSSETRTMGVARPGDSDGDGASDANELISGTDPFDAGSVLKITRLANGNRLVVWESVEGIRYEVLGTTNLAEPFQPISSIISASGASSFFYDTSSDATNKFYRIRVAP